MYPMGKTELPTLAVALWWAFAALGQTGVDTMPDTWVATDGLGRSVAGFAECGPPREDRTVGMFYFLWLGEHVKGGPHDITKILAQDPAAMLDPENPLWGPAGSMHHWGESIFGYYNSDDPYVLAKHAQMLGDAGVDVVIFDVTNQFTYSNNARALLDAFARVRQLGGRTPQVAFLCPFWTPSKVVRELAHEFYDPGVHQDLWFRWDGKPLLLADPDRLGETTMVDTSEQAVELKPGQALGQSFTAPESIGSVEIRVPTWTKDDGGATLTLRRDGPAGGIVMRRVVTSIHDNEWVSLRPDAPLPAGDYFVEISNPQGTVGWWTGSDDGLPGGQAFVNGEPVGGDRSLRLVFHDPEVERLRSFFTFRSPQPDYFLGPTKPEMWSWLEVSPQHVYRNSRGEKEQMSVGVAQNAVGSRLGSMSEPAARGRSFPQEVFSTTGVNFAEQFRRALAEDPRFLFVTGWNEWTASRYGEFNGIRLPVMFVDQFDQEHSRDIEPMKQGHGDAYYYQLVDFIRRYKGVRPHPVAGPARTVHVEGDFAQWEDVVPVYRDDAGDTLHRDWPGYNNHTRYLNTTGRNDFVLAQVAHDGEQIAFHVACHEPITEPEGASWMLLLLDIDGQRKTGWNGYDILINRTRGRPGRCTVERFSGMPTENDWTWSPVGEASFRYEGRQLHLAVSRRLLGLAEGRLQFDFCWADNTIGEGQVDGCRIDRFTTDGDVAPNGRFNYRYSE